LYPWTRSTASDKTWEGTKLPKSEWLKFQDGDIWKAFLYELEDREKYLTQLFKDSDKEWPPDVIKGKMTEIDFFKQIPTLILLSIRDKEINEKEKKDAE